MRQALCLGVLHDAGFGSGLAVAAMNTAHRHIVLAPCRGWVWKVLEMDWRGSTLALPP
jgi:hypothetical protein